MPGENYQHQNPSGERQRTTTSDIVGSAGAAVIEQLVMQPFDTLAKRQMKEGGSMFTVVRQLHLQHGALAGTSKLWSGLLYALARKGPTRVYKFTAQSELNAFMSAHFAEDFQHAFGAYDRVLMQGIAGIIPAFFEPVPFHPIDTMQIRKQVGQTSDIKALGMKGLYRGALITGLFRNAPGSFALFGGSAYTNQLLNNADHRSEAKNLFAKWVGAQASIIVAQPGDVIKTNMQTQQKPFSEIIQSLSWKQLMTRGFAARSVVALKVAVGFRIAEFCMDKSREWFGEEPALSAPRSQTAAIPTRFSDATSGHAKPDSPKEQLKNASIDEIDAVAHCLDGMKITDPKEKSETPRSDRSKPGM